MSRLRTEDWERIFGNSRTFQEEIARMELYKQALHDMWKDTPCDVTQKRLAGFQRSVQTARLSWMNWVEQRAQVGSPQWCVDLVGMVIARKIGASQ